MKKRIVILVHGGAGKRRVSQRVLKTLRKALENGYFILKQGGSALDAVEMAMRVLEDDENFNAGTGSRLQLDGVARMDASIMDGKSLRAGAVASLEGIKNPISAARLVMEKTPHVLMVGEKAREFALANGIEDSDVITDRSAKLLKKYLTSKERIVDLYHAAFGRTHRFAPTIKIPDGGETVGAVALDREGNLASGSSTGGSTLMLPGRVGDTPIIGSGIYADNRVGAISSTGMGESIIRMVLAKEISFGMEKGDSPLMASQKALEKMSKRVGGTGGVIALRKDGRFALVHNTRLMGGGVLVEGKGLIVKSYWGPLSKRTNTL